VGEKVGLDRWYCNLILLHGKQRGLIAQRTFKWRQTGSNAGQGVVCILHPGELLAPGRCDARRHAAVGPDWSRVVGSLGEATECTALEKQST